jgi:hypothetical protein
MAGASHPARAASPPHHRFAGSLAFRGVRSLGRALPSSARAREYQAVSGSVTSSAQLDLPASAFPDGSYMVNDQDETTADVESLPFASAHQTSYAALGMLGGRFEYYTTRMPDGLFDVAYLGTYYPSPAQARAAFDDVTQNPSAPSGIACAAGESCMVYQVSIVFPDGLYLGLMRIVQQSNALAEIITVVPEADYTQLTVEMAANLVRVTSAFIAAVPPTSPTATATPPTVTTVATSTATPAPTNTATPTATATPVPVEFTILSARAEKNGSSPDPALTRAPVRRVRVGTRVDESVYIEVQSAPGDATAQYSVRITRGGRQVLQRSMTEPLDSARDVPYRIYVSFKPGHAGTYKSTWQVSVNGITKQATSSLSAHV